MGFSEKAKHYFYGQKKLSNREIARIMDNYNEQLVSRYLNSDKISASFIMKVRAYFPDASVDDWTKDDNGNNVHLSLEPVTTYETNPIKKINRIIKELEELKKSLSQK